MHTHMDGSVLMNCCRSTGTRRTDMAGQEQQSHKLLIHGGCNQGEAQVQGQATA